MTAVQIPWAPGALFLHVICRLGEPRPDGSDADEYPNLMTQGGTVALTCNASRIKYRETDGRQRTLSGVMVNPQVANIHGLEPLVPQILYRRT